jgi:hypothetical protein
MGEAMTTIRPARLYRHTMRRAELPFGLQPRRSPAGEGGKAPADYRPDLLVEMLDERPDGARAYSVRLEGPWRTQRDKDHATVRRHERWEGATVTAVLAAGFPPELVEYLAGPDELHDWRPA